MSFGSPPVVDFIRGESTAEKPFVPLVGTLAAAINQVAGERFLSDATQLANGLQRAQRLFDLDAVCVVPDPVLLAEALGVTVEWDDEHGRFAAVETMSAATELGDPDEVTDAGRVPVVLDAADRLVTSTDDDVAVFGVLPGPQTTGESVFGESLDDDARADPIRAAIGTLARAFGRAGVDGLLVLESPLAAGYDRSGAGVEAVASETLSVLDNIGEFFGTALVFAPASYQFDVVERVVAEGGVDAVVLDTDAPGETALTDVRVGGGITASLLDGDRGEIDRTVAATVDGLPAHAFLASGVEIRDVHPRTLQAISRAVEAADY